MQALHMNRCYSNHNAVGNAYSSEPCGRSGRSTTLQIQNFKFLKEMGLKKPAFLPDFGKVIFLTRCILAVKVRLTWASHFSI